MKILFSIPAHENNEVVCNVIENIQKFIKEPIIVIHPNQSFSDFDSTIPEKYQNVYVNNSRIAYTKFHSMLPILISNFRFSEQFEYDYHCVFHTNQLFIKHGLEEYIKGKDMSFEYFYDRGSLRSQHMFNCSKSKVESLIKDENFNSHIEGTFYKKEVLKKVCDFIESDMPEVVNFHDAIEETVWPTLAYHLFVDKNNIAPTYIKHTEQNQIGIDDVRHLLEKNKPTTIFKGFSTNTDCVFSIKPVHRDVNNELRIFINQL
jgi:hypothetical protein